MTTKHSSISVNTAFHNNIPPRKEATYMMWLSPWSFIFLYFGLLSIGLFQFDIFFPLWLSVTLIALVVFYVIRQFNTERMGALMVLLFLVFMLPFIHIPEYLWYDFSGPEPLYGFGRLVSNPYMFDQDSITLTAMLGVTGVIGIAFGTSLSNEPIISDKGQLPDGSLRRFKTMTLPIWIIWVLFGLAFSIISTPPESIFTAQYTESYAVNNDWNFSSAWMISYVILSFTFIDALVDFNPWRRRFKKQAVIIVVAYVVIVLQFLRGDRAAVPWVFGIFLMYYYWAAAYTQKKKSKINWWKLGLVVFVLLIVSMIVGEVRHGLVGADSESAISLVEELWNEGAIGFGNLLQGTWSAVLLTPLSVAGDDVNNLLAMKWGQDYWDIILSLPPGFVADFIGYERPLGILKGPAMEMRYGIGGTHAVVLPFMNFRMFGVFIIQAMWAYYLNKAERITVSAVSVKGLSFLISIALAAPTWLWYGEKAGVNAFFIWAILVYCYRLSLSFSNYE